MEKTKSEHMCVNSRSGLKCLVQHINTCTGFHVKSSQFNSIQLFEQRLGR